MYHYQPAYSLGLFHGHRGTNEVTVVNMGENDNIRQNHNIRQQSVHKSWGVLNLIFILYIFFAVILPFWPLSHCDPIWRHRHGSTLAQIVVCCPMAPSHPLNKCWLIIVSVILHSHRRNITISAWTLCVTCVQRLQFWNCAISPRCQLFNSLRPNDAYMRQ